MNYHQANISQAPQVIQRNAFYVIVHRKKTTVTPESWILGEAHGVHQAPRALR